MQYAYANRATVDPTLADPVDARLNWLMAANAETEDHLRLFRRPAHEFDLALMARPLDARRAYELLGLMLGTLPPAVIFTRLFGYGLTDWSPIHWGAGPGLLFLCLMMNLVCGLVGYLMGRAFGPQALKVERRSCSQMIPLLALLGLAWGAVTGIAGGFFFFGVGAAIGPVFAIPVGITAFLVFGLLHRLLERGGMIDWRHFLPVASGITAVICALIAGVR